jgi:hypothetical protein
MACGKGAGARDRGGICKRGGNGDRPGRRNNRPTSGITTMNGDSTIDGGNGRRGNGTPGEHSGNGRSDEVDESRDAVREDSPTACFRTSFTSMLDLVPQEYRGYQNEMEFRTITLNWQKEMQPKKFSTNSLNEVLPVLRRVATLARVTAALIETPNPFAQAIRMEALSCAAKLLDLSVRYIPKLAEGDWVGAILQVFQDIREPTVTDFDVEHQQKRLYDHWCRTFAGNSLQALQTTVQHYQSNWQIAYAERYSKSINIVQSSGTGKSRLADEMGKTNFQFPFVFRNPGETGYPPGDTEITDYFRQRSDDPSILVAGFYGALGSIG